ncbi:MAG: hypothetical protein ACOY94_01905 [Bacillota bacterium]
MKVRFLTLIMVALVVGCSNPGSATYVAIESPAPFTDGVFVQQGELLRLDLETQSVQLLLPSQGDMDFITESAVFTGDGKALLIHRDKEGRDSWWAARADGSDLRRLPLPTDRQVRQVLRLGLTEFVGLLADGRLVRFDLAGSYEAWEPASDDKPVLGIPATGSPSGNAVAYVAPAGVVVLVPGDGGLIVACRTFGKEIFGWLGNGALVTGDGDALHVLDLPCGPSKPVAYRSVFGDRSGLITVSGHPQGKVLYAVKQSSIPSGGSTIAAIDPRTLQPLASLPGHIPTDSRGAPQFSPLGRYEVWPVRGHSGSAYAASAVVVKVGGGEVLQVEDTNMVSVAYSFHPRDLGFVFTDLSRRGTALVYQDRNGHRHDLKVSPEGWPIRWFEWNPRSGEETGP